jgi:hypothetical protein
MPIKDTVGPEVLEYDRPTRHGKILGNFLRLMAETGRTLPGGNEIPESCLTCAFSPGTMPNISAGTGMVAFNCVVGINEDDFACHHGMKEGEPTKLCAGYLAALLVPFDLMKQAMFNLNEELNAMDTSPDELRIAFDAWRATIDPEMKLDVYQLGREYAKRGDAS